MVAKKIFVHYIYLYQIYSKQNLANNQFHKTRIAPTPSGYLHLGNVLSFAITAYLAQQHNAKILLRIDDLDHQRATKHYVQDIFDTLDFLQLPYHEGPRNYDEYKSRYSQLQRMEMYQNALEQLKNNGDLFACTCTRAQLAKYATYPGTCRGKALPFDADDTCWRLQTDGSSLISVKTLEGTITASLPANMYDFVVRKKDGFPAYQLASVLDDIYYGVDLVIRGEDLWPSTLAQLYLAGKLGADDFKKVTFYHHPLLSGDEGEKLSK